MRIRAEHRDINKSPFSVPIHENMDQKNAEYGHFLRGASSRD